jgi:hypothetical protein
MQSSVFEFFDKLVDDFSWRRLIFVVVVIVSTVILAIGYESYTSHFQISKMKEVVSLIKEISSLPPEFRREIDSESSDAIKKIMANLVETSKESGIVFNIHINIQKALAAFSPWLILLFVFLILNPPQIREVSIGVIICAAIFSLIGALLPTFKSSWVNFWLYPVGHFFFLMILLFIFRKIKRT